MCEHECMRRRAPIIYDLSGRRSHQAWVSQYRPDMYLESRVRSEFPHEGPLFCGELCRRNGALV